MRTKALLCLAALAAGVTCVQGQNVYSANVVGYINVAIPANQYVLIANQLNTTNNTIASVLAGVPDGAQFQKYSGGYTAFTYDELTPGWLPDGNATLNPGEGGFFRSPVATTLTFVGEVMQGSLTNTLPAGSYVVRSSMVPQAATPTVLGVPADDGDTLQTYSAGFTAYTYDELTPGWLPSEPTIGLGQGFFYKKSSLGTKTLWVRNFTVE